jgi:cell division protein FtsI/penicillin-binding protein 2
MSFINQRKLISPFFIHNFILSPNLFGKKLEVTEKYSSINGTISKQIFSTRTCSFILGFLEEVLHYGTAQRGKIRNQRLAGKTGTSVFPVNGQIDQSDEPTNQRLTSFLIAYPLPSPQYLCFLLLHLNNDSIEQSATTAVPLVKALVDVLIQLVRSK